MKIVKKLFTIGTIVTMCMMSLVGVHATSYDVIFRTGSHGTLQDGTHKALYTIDDGYGFPDEPDVKVEAGYAFLGWNEQLPPSGSQVDGQMEFVAKYKVLTNGKEYLIKYVDAYGNALASDKVMQADLHDIIHVRAKTVKGYTPDALEKSITIKETNNVVQFTYKNGEETPLTREVVNEIAAGDGQNANQPNGDNTNPDEKKVVDKENVKDNTQPKGKGERSNQNSMIGFVAAAGVLAMVLLLLLLIKRRNKAKQESN